MSKTFCDSLFQDTFSIEGPPCPRVGAGLVAMRGTKSNTSNVLQNQHNGTQWYYHRDLYERMEKIDTG